MLIWTGIVPDETEMKKIVRSMVGEECEGSAHLGAFLTQAKKLIADRKYRK